MKSLIKKLLTVTIFASITSCGTGGSADSGTSVLLEMEISPSFLEIDLVEKINKDNDNLCDVCYIPLGDSVQITFRSVIPETSTIQPSDITVTSYSVTYIPKTLNVSPLEADFKGSCTIPAGQTVTCNFPIFVNNLKKILYDSRWYDDYDLKITVKAKEVIYNKTLTLTGYTTARISDIVQNGEANCICPKDKIQIGN